MAGKLCLVLVVVYLIGHTLAAARMRRSESDASDQDIPIKPTHVLDFQRPIDKIDAVQEGVNSGVIPSDPLPIKVLQSAAG